MSLHPTMKRRLHERLHPLIGEEEADALLDEISPPDPVTREWLRDELDLRLQPFVTREWIDGRFDRMEDRFESRFERIDQRFERIDQRFERIDQKFERVDALFREQLQWTVGGIGVIATVLTIAQIIWG